MLRGVALGMAAGTGFGFEAVCRGAAAEIAAVDFAFDRSDDGAVTKVVPALESSFSPRANLS
jgi:hypothetical protein